MKTTKLVTVLTMLLFGMLAYTQESPDHNVIRVPISKAIENPGLVKAMYRQIDQSLIQPDHPSYYTARVVFGHTAYIIYGKFEEWKHFFVMDPGKNLLKKGRPQG